MRDFRINLDETAREREIRICQSPAYEIEAGLNSDEQSQDQESWLEMERRYQ